MLLVMMVLVVVVILVMLMAMMTMVTDMILLAVGNRIKMMTVSVMMTL